MADGFVAIAIAKKADPDAQTAKAIEEQIVKLRAQRLCGAEIHRTLLKMFPSIKIPSERTIRSRIEHLGRNEAPLNHPQLGRPKIITDEQEKIVLRYMAARNEAHLPLQATPETEGIWWIDGLLGILGQGLRAPPRVSVAQGQHRSRRDPRGRQPPREGILRGCTPNVHGSRGIEDLQHGRCMSNQGTMTWVRHRAAAATTRGGGGGRKGAPHRRRRAVGAPRRAGRAPQGAEAGVHSHVLHRGRSKTSWPTTKS